MIDWARVAQLRDEVGGEDFLEVVELFLGEVEAEIATLSPAQDSEEIMARLHCLKGSALNLGFTAFADLCHGCEQSVQSGAFTGSMLAAIPQGYERSKAEFENRINAIAAA